jgi:hypothetical protein
MSLVIISLLIILYNTYTYKCEIEAYTNYNKGIDDAKYDNNPNKEGFMNYLIDWEQKGRNYKDKVADIYNTTLENYKSGVNFHNSSRKYYYNYIELSDVKNNNPFFTYGCIKDSIKNDILSELQKKFYVSYYDFYSISVNDIMQKVANDIENTVIKMNGTQLKDPIYFLIFQAPYLQFNNENYIARHDSINNLKPSYDQDIENINIGEKPLFTKLIIMYPYYYNDPNDPNKILPYADETGYQAFKDYFNNNKMSRDKLCFIECNGVNGYACGCMNLDKTRDNTMYSSKCINLNNEYFNYGMIYAVNKFNPLFTKNIQTKHYPII